MIRLNNGTSYSLTDLPKNVTVGKYSSIASGVSFLKDGTHLAETNHKCVFTTNWDQPVIDLKINIGNDVWVGQGANFLYGVTIGNGAIIGAYTVVAKDVPAYAVVVGNPYRIIRMRFTPEQIEELNKINWWDWDSKTIESRKNDMKDIDVFLSKYKEAR